MGIAEKVRGQFEVRPGRVSAEHKEKELSVPRTRQGWESLGDEEKRNGRRRKASGLKPLIRAPLSYGNVVSGVLESVGQDVKPVSWKLMK